MFETEKIIRKRIITPDGEDEFQIRYVLDENVGLLTTRSGKSYSILDSIDYWFDCTQTGYPPKRKCKCKNSFFNLYFDYLPRVGTDDYRSVKLISRCTECGKQSEFAAIDIDYSPTNQLFEQPIAYCENPKLKYKKYIVSGYWEDSTLCDLIDFLSRQQLLIFCWYWGRDRDKRYIEKFTAERLKDFLFKEKMQYLHIYFSMNSLDEILAAPFDDKGIMIENDIWRKEEIIDLSSILVGIEGAGRLYIMEFSSEYIEAGQLRTKSEAFCNLARNVWEYSRKMRK